MTKDALRKELLQKRAALTRPEALKKDLKIKANLFKLNEFNAARVVLAYLPIKAEVGTSAVIGASLVLGKKIAIPSVRRGSLIPVEFEGYSSLVRVRYGTLEPANPREIPKDKIDMALVPGVVFDERCNRIGYGKGFYDRFLRGCAAVKVGLAYNFQVRPAIPAGKNDIRMDKIVTESRIIGCE